jgi:galactokinase
MIEDIRKQFQQIFGKQHQIAAAPGRVNMIGEHTDYNNGFVLPGAIDKNIFVGLAPAADNRLNLRAVQYGEAFSFALDQTGPVKGWPTYLLGMIHMLLPEKRLPYGLDVVVSGEIPVGAGLSSSAALCSAFGLALNEIFDLGQTRLELALAGQKTEQQFAGLQCGIMDQFASLHGKAGHLIKLDCRSLAFEYIPFDFPDHRIVLVNTMVSHLLASSEYNLRREQCEAGVALLQRFYPEIQSLRDATEIQLHSVSTQMNPVDFSRCRFVVEENQRLLDGCVFLKEKNLEGFGRLMYASHEGLSRDYEVSCPESDFLVEETRKIAGVRGARQMGGGFGGCMIALVENDAVESFIASIQERYRIQFLETPDCYIMNISEGAKIL